MAESRLFESLSAALDHRRVPRANWPLIEHIAGVIGSTLYEVRGDIIFASRPDRSRPVKVHSGYTTGFTSEDEARAASGDLAVEIWENSSPKNTWGVTHPINSIRGGNTTSRGADVVRPVCPTCWIEIPAPGACDTCG